MAERQWIRLDVDFEDTDWLVDLDPLAQFAWVKFCCRVKAEGTGGRWRKRNVTALRNRLALPDSAITEMLAAAMAGDDPAVVEEDGDWVVTGWDRYYPTDRTNADRQRRWRDRQKEDGRNDSNVTRNTRNGVTTSRATVDVDVDVETDTTASDEATAFDAIWARYPKRLGGNPKQRALKALRARIREGVETADILEGLDRYIEYLEKNGRVGTEYVMQAATFLGPDRRWTEEWSTSKQQNGTDQWADFRNAYTYDPGSDA